MFPKHVNKQSTNTKSFIPQHNLKDRCHYHSHLTDEERGTKNWDPGFPPAFLPHSPCFADVEGRALRPLPSGRCGRTRRAAWGEGGKAPKDQRWPGLGLEEAVRGRGGRLKTWTESSGSPDLSLFLAAALTDPGLASGCWPNT